MMRYLAFILAGICGNFLAKVSGNIVPPLPSPVTETDDPWMSQTVDNVEKHFHFSFNITGNKELEMELKKHATLVWIVVGAILTLILICCVGSLSCFCCPFCYLAKRNRSPGKIFLTRNNPQANQNPINGYPTIKVENSNANGQIIANGCYPATTNPMSPNPMVLFQPSGPGLAMTIAENSGAHTQDQAGNNYPTANSLYPQINVSMMEQNERLSPSAPLYTPPSKY